MRNFPSIIKSSALVTFVSFWMSGCVNAQTDEWVSLEHTAAEELFAEKCGMCHRDSGMGTGILARRMAPELAKLEDRQDLQAAYVQVVVRNGFNNMFPLSRGEVSDEQLAKIAAYLAKEGQ